MRRRDLITMVGGAAVAWPSSTDAQQPAKVPLVGILSDEASPLAAKSFEPFAQGLQDLGWVEGQNVKFEPRSSTGKDEMLPRLAAELVSLQPDVILAIGTPAARAAKTATQTIPIVFTRSGDPIGLGLVPSLARPSGNLTGLSIQNFELDAKRLELLINAAPHIERVGALWDPNFPPAGAELKEFEKAARSLNLELVPAEARRPEDFEPALLALMQHRAGALILVPGVIFAEHSQRMADLTAKARLPAMFPRREFVEAGGLMSYGTNLPGMYRRAAAYVDKILRGAKPADLPVEQPTTFEFVINVKTAKALRLEIPALLLALADEVIE